MPARALGRGAINKCCGVIYCCDFMRGMKRDVMSHTRWRRCLGSCRPPCLLQRAVIWQRCWIKQEANVKQRHFRISCGCPCSSRSRFCWRRGEDGRGNIVSGRAAYLFWGVPGRSSAHVADAGGHTRRQENGGLHSQYGERLWRHFRWRQTRRGSAWPSTRVLPAGAGAAYATCAASAAYGARLVRPLQARCVWRWRRGLAEAGTWLIALAYSSCNPTI